MTCWCNNEGSRPSRSVHDTSLAKSQDMSVLRAIPSPRNIFLPETTTLRRVRWSGRYSSSSPHFSCQALSWNHILGDAYMHRVVSEVMQPSISLRLVFLFTPVAAFVNEYLKPRLCFGNALYFTYIYTFIIFIFLLLYIYTYYFTLYTRRVVLSPGTPNMFRAWIYPWNRWPWRYPIR